MGDIVKGGVPGPVEPEDVPVDDLLLNDEFSGAMPKEEIGCLRFLKANPTYDGRGVVIAIFDTGIDPGAPGLQVTTDGKPKILDVIDCTGSGDVDTSRVVKVTEGHTITGATGRQLELNPAWANPTGEWRVGAKPVYDLLPKSLVSRIKEERRKRWDEAQRLALAMATAALSAFERDTSAGHPSIKGNTAAIRAELEGRVAVIKEGAKSYDDPGPLIDVVTWHDGSTWRVALDLRDLQKGAWPPQAPPPAAAAAPAPAAPAAAAAAPAAAAAAAPSPVKEAGGKGGKKEKGEKAAAPAEAAPSSTEGAAAAASAGATPASGAAAAAPVAAAGAGAGSGQKQQQQGPGLLRDFVPLADFKEERKYATFPDPYAANFAVKVYDNGATTCIVVDCGAHGTHVAGITSAHFPDDPGANGIAPGAQLISCKVGDTRLGSMETGAGLTRALIAALEHKADLINMSYGEPTTTPNAGRFIELASEVVNKHGIIFVASAGNSGPALSTVGAPGGTSSALLAVGAYVSPALASAGHSVLHTPVAGIQYTWSSRGPTPDGHLGVAFSAPGGAIASVPTWTHQRRQLMNGTSMASPNACGGLALMLSGAKQAGRRLAGDITPTRVRRALEETCLLVGGDRPDAPLTYGSGLIQVDAAYEYLLRSAQVDEPDVRYEVTLSPVGGGGASPRPLRGIYLREPHQAVRPSSFSVTVYPKLHEDASTTERAGVEVRVVMEVSEAWVAAPPHLLLHSSSRSFEVRVDPTGLPPGLHYAEVEGYDSRARWRGPLFRVPITVVRPLAVPNAPPPAGTLPAPFAASAQPSALPAPPSASGPPSTVGATAAADPAGGASPGLPKSGIPPPPTTTSPSFIRTPSLVRGTPYYSAPPLGADNSGAGVAVAAAAVPNQGAPNGPVPVLPIGPLELGPGSESRTFVAVPEGATWAELVLRAGTVDTPKVYLLRATQLAPEAAFRDTETRTQVTLSSGSEYTWTFPVIGGATLELTVAQFWSSSGPSSLSGELSVHGVTLAGGEGAAAAGAGPGPGASVVVDGAAGVRRVLVRAPLRAEKVKPEAKLTAVLLPVRPSEAVIEPLATPRDTLPEGRVVYRLLLTYKFTASEGGKYKPTLPALNSQVYDSPLEGQMYMVHEAATKKLMAVGDVYPEYVTLKKGGEYLIRLALRHDSPEVLEKTKAVTLVMKRKLDSSLTLPVYSSLKDAVVGGSSAGEMLLRPGDTAALFIGSLPDDKLPKDAGAGRVLVGKLTLGQQKRGSGAAPGAPRLTYIAQPPPEKPPTPKDAPPAAASSSAPNGSANGSSAAAANGAAAAAAAQPNGEGGKDGASGAAAAGHAPADPTAQQPGAAAQGAQEGHMAVSEAEKKVQEALRDATIKALKDLKLDDPEQSALYNKLVGSLKATYPRHLPMLSEHLRRLDASCQGSARKAAATAPSALRGIVEAADDVIGAVDEKELAVVAAVKSAEDTPEWKATKQRAEEGRTALLEALHLKALTLLDLEDLTAAASSTGSTTDKDGVGAEVEAAWAALRKWVDTGSETAYVPTHARMEARAGRLAGAVQALNKALTAHDEGKAPSGGAGSSAAFPARKDLLERKRALLAAAGWAHLSGLEELAAPSRFPAAYPPF